MSRRTTTTAVLCLGLLTRASRAVADLEGGPVLLNTSAGIRSAATVECYGAFHVYSSSCRFSGAHEIYSYTNVLGTRFIECCPAPYTRYGTYFWTIYKDVPISGTCYGSDVSGTPENTFLYGDPKTFFSNEVCIPTALPVADFCPGDGDGGGGIGVPGVTADIHPLLPFNGCGTPRDPCCSSPILIDLRGNGFRLTGPSELVAFDLNADGKPEHTCWTDPGGGDVFLALDLNGNGRIDSGRELFGNFTLIPGTSKRAKNGYEALTAYDGRAFGGNGDGYIDEDDAIYDRLLVWSDENHNGISEPSELRHLRAAHVVRINLKYHESHTQDQWGNAFQFWSKATLEDDRGHRRTVDTVDVFFKLFQ